MSTQTGRDMGGPKPALYHPGRLLKQDRQDQQDEERGGAPSGGMICALPASI